MAAAQKKEVASRITVSLAPSLCRQLDRMVTARGFANRSQAVAKMLADHIAEDQHEFGHQVMAATVTLIYHHLRTGVESRLSKIQHRYLKEVISIQRVHLARKHTLEVVLLQAPGVRLKQIADELLACKGVKNGRLYVCSEILPPIY
ncbi:MAG: nickel-responsive transcriptional regulator NikR [Chthoniobacteraceae bacterium]